MQARVGSKRALAEASFFMPLGCSEDELLFMDLRPKIDTRDNLEGNIGLGFRKRQPDAIVGGYGYLDRRRSGQTGQYFSQVTLGVERLTEDTEMRANIYVPLTSAQTVNGGSSGPYLAGTGIFIDRAARTREEALPGIDVEYGRTWQSFRNTNLTLNGGAYHFNGEEVSNVNGVRLRGRFDIGNETNLALVGEAQYDNLRKEQFWGGVSFRIPFGKEQGKHTGLNARMTQPVVRDVDIVTNGETTAGGTEAVLNAQTGTAQRVFYVDNSAATVGDGSLNAPFQTLAAASTAANAAYDVIYVNIGLGTSVGMNQGITLAQTGQMLIGSGSRFVYDSGTFTTSFGGNYSGATLRAAGVAPVLTNNSGGNAVTLVADKTSVTGFTITGADRDGIAIQNAANTMVYNVDITNNTRYGLYAYSNNGSTLGDLSVRDVNISGHSNIGSYLFASGAGSGWDNIAFNNVDITGSNNRGAYVTAQAGAVIDSVSIDNLTSGSNTSTNGRGLDIYATGVNSSIGAVNVANSSFTGNQREGLYLHAENSGHIGAVDISDTSASGNSYSGISILAQSSGSLDSLAAARVTSENNLTTNGHGFLLNLNGSSADVSSVDVSESVFRNNGGTGLYVQTQNAANIDDVTLTDVIADGNTNIGVYVNAQTAGQMGTVRLTDIQSRNNTNTGIYVYARSDANIADLDIRDSVGTGNTGSSGRGLVINANGAGSGFGDVNVSNSTFSDNDQQGVYLLSQADALIETASLSSITAERNSRAGVDVAISSAGYIQSLEMDSLTASGNLTGNGRGISISASGAGSGLDTVSVTNSDALGNGAQGLYLQSTASAAIGDVTFDGNDTSNNANAGQYLIVQNSGSVDTVATRNAVSSGNNNRGFYTITQSGGVIDTLSFDNVEASDNTSTNGRGFDVLTSAGTVGDMRVADSTFNNNGSYGVYFLTQSSAMVDSIVMRDIITNNNTSVGTYVTTQSSAQVDRVTIEGSVSSGNNNRGYYLLTQGGAQVGNVLLDNLTANANTSTSGRGIEVSVGSAGTVVTDLSLLNSTFNNNESYGSYLVASSSSAITTALVQNHTTNGNASVGSYFVAQSGGSFGGLTLDNATANGNNNTGVYLLAQSAGTVGDYTFSNVTASNNTSAAGRGLRITATGAGSTLGAGTVEGFTAQNNDAQGAYISVVTGGVIDSLSLENGSLSNNGAEGLRVDTSGTAPDLTSMIVRNMMLAGNATQGMYIRATGSSAISSMLVEQTTVTGNGSYGVYIDDDTSGTYAVDFGGGAFGSIGNNRIFDNADREVRVDLDNGLLKAENNWWGVATGLAPAELQRDGSSNIDADPFLTVDPNP